MAGTLYLFPVTIGETPLEQVIPDYNQECIRSIRFFIVENLRTARRFLKKNDPEFDIDGTTFYELNKHTHPNQIAGFLKPLEQGFDVGVMSEAGVPAVADPGADVVSVAQRMGFRVVPLVGPSSLLMSLMASGFNGQSFAFHGYLPIESAERQKRIRQLEGRIYNEDQTQLFIETPYRNNKLLDDLIQTCRSSTKLCIASDITSSTEFIRTLPVKEWIKHKPDLNKKPTVFLLYK